MSKPALIDQLHGFKRVLSLLFCLTLSLVIASSPKQTVANRISDHAMLWPERAREPSTGQQTRSLRPRAFVLEGLFNLQYDQARETREPVMVDRNGRTIELRPGDELQEGDHIYRGGKYRVRAGEMGGAIAIYNEDGIPAMIIEDTEALDITISKLKFGFGHKSDVEIINRASIPPRGEANTQDIYGSSLSIKKPNGMPERPLTQNEYDRMSVAVKGGEDFMFRWDRADLIIQQGRKGAEKDYWQMQDELKRQVAQEAAAANPPPKAKEPRQAIQKTCTAQENAAFGQMTGSWKGWRSHVTINGPCDAVTGTVEWMEYCEGIDAPYNKNLTTYKGKFQGVMSGTTLMVNWEQPAKGGHPATSGSGTCSVNNGELTCSGVGCEVRAKKG